MNSRMMSDGLERQTVLDSYGVIDTPSEAVFDDLTRLAAQICEVSGAMISLLGKERLWLKSRLGISVREERLEHSLGIYALEEQNILVVPDTHKDPRFVNHPKVRNTPYVRFFAGAVLRSAEGVAFGTLSIFGPEPRDLSNEQKDALLILARQVVAQLELRKVLHQVSATEGTGAAVEQTLQEDATVLETLARVGAELTAELDLDRLLQKITDAATKLTGAQFGALFHTHVNEDGETYQLYTLSGAPMEAFSRFPEPRKTDVFGPTFRGEGIVRSSDITQDPRYGRNNPHAGLPTGHLPVRSYLAVPVVSRSEEVIGGLLFGHPEPGVFTDRSERLATGIAAQAAIALDNARLYKLTTDHQARLQHQVEERTRELEEANQRLQREIEERKQAEEALRQAQKMEAIGQLTGGVAHDFNNLLQVIGANLQLLEEGVKEDEVLARRLCAATSAVDRGAKLSSQLLAFARRQPLEPKSINLGRRLRNMEELLQRTLGVEISLKLFIDEALWPTYVDPAQVENAVLNLALNARDAMSHGGSLTIGARNAVLDAEYAAKHKDVAPGDYVALDISDTGCGMPPELTVRVFEPFFTTKEEGRGTGLGLSQVYGFVKQSNGHISIYSELEHGTTVKLYLPRASKEDETSAEIVSGPVERGSETILVAEDDPEVRATTVDMLSELGYQVLKAVDGQSALSIIESGIPIDLLFSDVVMPGPVKALDLARSAQEIQPDMAVLVTSGYTQIAIVHDGRLDPGVDLLGKPYRRDQLAHKIRHVLRNREQKLAARQAQGEQRSAAPVLAQNSVLNVLMVEDDAELLELMSLMVEGLGHEATLCSSGNEALAALEKNNTVSVMITDVELPGMSGIELARRALKSRPDLQIVFASGYGRNLDTAGLPTQNIRMLPKPYGIEEVEQILQSVTGAERSNP
jgi:signal transduction histidine kinase/DNA-binding response OmpR family regulator